MILFVVLDVCLVVVTIELPETHVFQCHGPDIVHKIITQIVQEQTVYAVNLSYMVTNAVTYSVYDDYPMGGVVLSTAFLITEFVTSSNEIRHKVLSSAHLLCCLTNSRLATLVCITAFSRVHARCSKHV